MLNRRTLRIKVMQSLFAYDQCIEANNLLALDLIDERFAPDLNSMEVQDKAGLKSQKKEARLLYENKFKKSETKESSNEAVNKAVADALDLYSRQSKKDFSFLKKNMVSEVEKINFWYHSVLGLLLGFVDVAQTDKKENHSAFFNNKILKSLEKSDELQKILLKEGANWENDRVLIMGWFRDTIKPDKTYKEHISDSTPDLEAQKNILKHITRKLILGEGPINDYFSERDIRWAEDHDIVKSLVDKTLKSYNPETETVQLQKLTLDWEDDLAFIETLFEGTINIGDEKKELIARNTKNWEVDRLPLTDRIILEMAIAELIHFPGIPVKVTINEYIELTKHYSTPKSPKFVNGILDVIAKELQTTGVVKKSGRGLIDNK